MDPRIKKTSKYSLRRSVNFVKTALCRPTTKPIKAPNKIFRKGDKPTKAKKAAVAVAFTSLSTVLILEKALKTSIDRMFPIKNEKTQMKCEVSLRFLKTLNRTVLT